MADLASDSLTPTSDALEILPQSWIKRVLPRTMFGRSLLLIVAPLILVQIISAAVFYGRHWEAVSRRLSADVAGDIAMLIETLKTAPSDAAATRLMEQAAAASEISFSLERHATLPPPLPHSGSLLEDELRRALTERVRLPYRLDAISDQRDILLQIGVSDGVLSAGVPRKRLSTATASIFIMWMLGSSAVLLLVAGIFLRNQVKSLRRLAAAAEGFGKGRPVVFNKVEGALEVRQAAVAFIQMRDRIQRQIAQRTEMLAGVSHDLRTPLTRMKLALELLGDDPAVAGLKSDVGEMEHLVQLYLDFARGEGTETAIETDVVPLLDDIAAAARRNGIQLSLDQPEELVVPVRPNALRRCIGNLVANAGRYGSHVWIAGRAVDSGVDIVIDDDGPGIPPAERDHVFQPFIRLDASRNPRTGGVGLGLTIARDAARSHGGDVRLDTAPQGGLRATVHLPR